VGNFTITNFSASINCVFIYDSAYPMLHNVLSYPANGYRKCRLRQIVVLYSSWCNFRDQIDSAFCNSLNSYKPIICVIFNSQPTVIIIIIIIAVYFLLQHECCIAHRVDLLVNNEHCELAGCSEYSRLGHVILLRLTLCICSSI